MSNDITPPNRALSSDLHPFVWVLIVALALWFILSVWLFASSADADYLLVVVSGFIFIAVALPATLWRVARKRNEPDNEAKDAISFRDWASADFDTWQGRLPGATAAVQILLPIAAVAFGMTAFGIVFHFAAHGVT